MNDLDEALSALRRANQSMRTATAQLQEQSRGRRAADEKARAALIEWLGYYVLLIAALLLGATLGAESSPWARFPAASMLVLTLGLWAWTCHRRAVQT